MDALLIERARREAGAYQRRLTRDPTTGAVVLADEPHLLVPTRVVGRDLPGELRESVGPELAAEVMYRLGFLTAASQAAAFYRDRGVAEPEWEYRTLAGPFYAAWTGQGEAEMLIWEPSIEDDFLVVWESGNSLGALQAMKDGVRARACHLFAGYSAGWCSEATGQRLQTTEIACRAEGLAHCRFVVANPKRMEEHLADPRLHKPTDEYEVLRTRPL
jgi:hypothetical protein